MIDLFDVDDFKEIREEEALQAERLAKILLEIYDVGNIFNRILDVGCATGLYLKPFRDLGLEVIGVEIRKDAAVEAGTDIPEHLIIGMDYLDFKTSLFDTDADLVICLEVLEHIEESVAEDFVKELCSHGAPIVFSAAQPGQGGKGHINCQDKSYWIRLFEANGFTVDNNNTQRVIDYMSNGYHMGWLTNNLMIFKKQNTDDPYDETDMTHDEFIQAFEKSVPAEIMNVDPNTGGMKASKPSQLGFIDPQALLTLGEVAGMGAEKYDKYNYLKGFDWSLCFNAMNRHALAFWNGEDLDPESGLPHIAHAAWQALALLSFYQRDIGNDDRPGTVIRPDEAD